MIDIRLYKENRNLKKRIDELESRVRELESSPHDLLIQAMNLYLKDNNEMDQFFKFIRNTTYARCVNTENELLKRWEKE